MRFGIIQVICIVSLLFLQGIRIGSNITMEFGEANDHNNSQLHSSNSPTKNRRRTTLESLSGDDDASNNTPSCARDVHVKLRQDGDDPSNCKGLLIRDDIIITSKECSTKKHLTFQFAGVGDVTANPHTSLNEQLEILDDTEYDDSHRRLGFLLANPPYHYLYINRPVRRTRMFLSDRSEPIVDGTAAFITCQNNKPIAHNFPVDNGELISLGQLRDILPADILWEDVDIDTAIELQYKDYRWWTKPIKRKDEESYIDKMLKRYKGPPGSVSFYSAGIDSLDRMATLMEALDRRGHRRGCWPNYYERWHDEKPFSNTHFFDWLDFGGGKLLLERNEVGKTFSYMHQDEVCQKKNFNKARLHYFNDEERRKHEVYITPSEDGTQLIWRYKHNDEFVPENNGDEAHIYMWDLSKKFYIVDNTWDKEKFGIMKHTGIMAGLPALSGGEATFGKDGVIRGIDFFSGHYKPDLKAVAIMYTWMKDTSLDTTALHWVGVKDGGKSWDCRKIDWERRIQIPGFDAAALKQSCYEVTTSPTWILKADE